MQRKITTKEKVAFLTVAVVALPLYALYFYLFGTEPFHSSWNLGAAFGMLFCLPLFYLFTKSKENKLMVGIAWTGLTIPWMLHAWPVVREYALSAMAPGITGGVL